MITHVVHHRGRTLRIRALLAIALSIALRSHASAQQRFVTELTAPDSARIGYFGAISPDGSHFAYKVTQNRLQSVWILELPSLRSSQMSTPGDGLSDLVWSPDSRHLVFWRGDPGRAKTARESGLFLLDVATGRERRLASLAQADSLVPMPISWLNDGRIVTGHRAITYSSTPDAKFSQGLGPIVAFAVRANGDKAELPPHQVLVSGGGVMSRAGSAARVDSCCGGNRSALYLTTSHADLCVAGPLPETNVVVQWGEAVSDLYLLELARGSNAALIFRLNVADGTLTGITRRPEIMESVSVTRAGDIAIMMRNATGTGRSLWWIPADSIVSPTAEAHRPTPCPPVIPAVVALAHASALGAAAIIDPVVEDRPNDLAVYYVFDRLPSWISPSDPSGYILRQGARLGWISRELFDVPKASVSAVHDSALFPLRATDRYLLSDDFDRRLGADAGARAAWRRFAVGDSQTPLPDLMRILRKNAPALTGPALTNPNVVADSMRFEERLAFSEVNEQLALAALSLPSVRGDADHLAAIAALPRYRANQVVLDTIHSRMRDLAASLTPGVAKMPETIAYELLMACLGTGVCDPTVHALVGARPVAVNRFVLALAAACLNSGVDARPADSLLRRAKTTTEAELLVGIARAEQGTLPQNAGFMVQQCGAAHGRWRVLDALSRLDERFRTLRKSSMDVLVLDPSTPDSLLRVLTRGLPVRANPSVALRILRNPAIATDTQTLALLMQLNEHDYPRIPQEAASKMRQLAGIPEPPRAAPPPPPFPPLPRERAAVASGRATPPPPPPPPRWVPPNHCLGADAWAATLRGALGGHAPLVTSDSLCVRAAAALDTAFVLSVRPDSVYVFGAGDSLFAAFAPLRPGVLVTLVEFDSLFVERGRRSVLVP